MHKLFIVEDEYLEAEAMEIILEQQIPNVKVVGKVVSGAEALEGIKEKDPDIIIMDINIPEINGIEVLKQIKETSPEKNVILTTPSAEFEYAYQALKARADDMLLKPIRPEQLVEAVRNSIRISAISKRSFFDEKMNEIIYAIIQRRYNDTRVSIGEYVDTVYECFKHDIFSGHKEILRFATKLNTVTMDINNFSINHFIDERLNQQYFINHYQNPYILKEDLISVIDKMFNCALNNHGTMKNNLDEIINFIDRNARKELSLEKVSEFANVSSYYLSKIFKQETGYNFVEYLTARRMELAKDMLINTDEPILNVSISLAYHEPNYFSKVFKKSTGMTPTEYRKKYKPKKAKKKNNKENNDVI